MSERAKITAKKPGEKRDNIASREQKTESSKSQNSPIEHILFLEQTIGNHAVERLFKSGIIQAKLKIGKPGDIYEQEADRVADAVMRMPESQVRRQAEEKEELIQPKPLAEHITPLVQRQVEEEEEEEEEEKLQAKELPGQTPSVTANEGLRRQPEEKEEEEEMLQAKDLPGQTSEVTSNLETRINAIRGGGQLLPVSTRTFFEPRFGYDFSQVRVNADTRAEELARALSARAFTVGQDIMFGSGQYAPETSTEKRLVAHELTHMLQQGSDYWNISSSVLQRDNYDLTQTTITPEYAQSLSDPELEEQIQFLREYLQTHPGDQAIYLNLRTLEDEAFRRIPTVEVISADVTSDRISVSLEPLGTAGDLTLELSGPGGTHVIRTEARTGGTYNVTFDILRLRAGEYDTVRTTWRVSGTNYSDTFPYHIHVLGVYLHSQYNIPHESACAGAAVNVYITDSACTFTPSTLRERFVRQTNLNGSGVSIAHGKLQREAYCLGRSGAPADARGRSFRQVNAFYGSCNSNTGALNNSTVARPPAHSHLTCNDRVYIHTVGIKTVTDRCPGCSLTQLDNFTTATACAGICDLGNFMTIKLF